MIAAACWPRTILGAVLMSSTAFTVLVAQSGEGLTATVDVGASRIHYDGYLPSGLLDVAPAIRFDAPDAVLVARGSVARFESGNVNTQAAVLGSAFTPGDGPLRGELSGSGSLGYHQSIGNTGVAQVLGRLHVARADAGLWAGGGWGWSALGGGIGAGVATQEAGGWIRRRTGPGASLRATAIFRAIDVATVQYTEASAALRWTTDRLDLGAEGGGRWGERAFGSSGQRAWLAADAAFWVRPRVAVVASAGRFLSDPTTSAIGGRYASLGLRLAIRRPAPDELPRVILPRSLGAADRPGEGAGPAAPAAAEALAIEETGDGRVTLRFTLPGARSAELMGDFTGWTAVPLERGADGRWAVTLALQPGVHRVNLRTADGTGGDTGGAWRAPPGLTAVDDGFGGQVGLLVVSR